MSDMAEPMFFEAVLTPHRSLTRRGAWMLIGVIGALSGAVTLLFWHLGAWPVAGFNGAELVLATLLLRANARQARDTEIVQLRGRSLLIRRRAGAGPVREIRLDPGWLRVVLEDRAGRTPLLLLTTRGVHEEVGAALGEAEKRDLAAALRASLEAWRRAPAAETGPATH